MSHFLALAQCVMCSRTAAAQQAGRAEVLNHGILVLLIPPLIILVAFAWIVWRQSASRPLPSRDHRERLKRSP